jgi:hypothetical protein
VRGWCNTRAGARLLTTSEAGPYILPLAQKPALHLNPPASENGRYTDCLEARMRRWTSACR